jgi:hypothetical protein
MSPCCRPGRAVGRPSGSSGRRSHGDRLQDRAAAEVPPPRSQRHCGSAPATGPRRSGMLRRPSSARPCSRAARASPARNGLPPPAARATGPPSDRPCRLLPSLGRRFRVTAHHRSGCGRAWCRELA